MRGILPLAILLAALGGCRQPYSTAPPATAGVDRWLVETANDLAIAKAVVRQHTLYPYHFVEDAAELNELGQRDLAILAEHLREQPGVIHVRQGYADPAVYHRRLARVRQRLADAGVDVDRVRIEDAPPGGEGQASDQLIRVRRMADRPTAPAGALEGETP